LGFLLFIAGIFTGVRMASRVAKDTGKEVSAAAKTAPGAEAEKLAKAVEAPAKDAAAPAQKVAAKGDREAEGGKGPGKEAEAKPGGDKGPGKAEESREGKTAPGEDSSPDKDQGLEKVKYCVQVGAFLAKFSADEQLAVLKKLGYKAAIVEFRDSDSRLWYSVRMGQYARERDAFKAASEFSRKEKMYAEVRMIDSL
jgi:cell division protein FtsN